MSVTRSGSAAKDVEQLVDSLAAAIVVVDETGFITLANTRASEVLGKATSDLMGARVADVLLPLPSLLKEANRSEGRATQVLTGPDGEEMIIGYSVARQRDGAGVTVVLRDITELEQLRQERDRLLRLAAVSEVLPAILHELKNPLASIGTAVELMVEELPEGALQTDLHAVLSEIRRMGLTLDGLGSVGRDLQSNRHHAIDHALRDVFRVFARRASERNVRASCQVFDMPLLPLDAGVMRGVVFNLVTNALHACEPGDEVLLSAEYDSDRKWLSIRVSDTGSGMTPKVRTRCCELFYTTKPKGSGIGLALSLGAVRSANGTLDIESAPGQGTSIHIGIPIQSPAELLDRETSVESGVRARGTRETKGVVNVTHR